MASRVKTEAVEASATAGAAAPEGRRSGGGGGVSKKPPPVIHLDSSSSSESDQDSEDESVLGENGTAKKRRLDVVLPVGFLDPLPPLAVAPPATETPRESGLEVASSSQGCKQFWKAGDYEGAPCGDWDSSSGGMDHVRVHPKFLHSNATSHKWALGAFAELLDNALDEVCNGATFVNIDMGVNMKDGSKMLVIEDNGGGMDPDKMRHCMSLGYSVKSKIANTIGQYGNGFKTSTMRLGADVIVFSRCQGKYEKSPTQSIGLLSYTFLRSTGKEDIVVPMLDYEGEGGGWRKLIRSSVSDWNKNVDTVVQWSPFSTEADLLRQFSLMKDHGTRIIIYNLWEDDQGYLELDFSADPHDIQIRGVNRDEKNIQMAKKFPNSRHFLTYRHSLRSYASILYLRLPPGFRIILRGKDIEHHNIVNDMMYSEKVTYRPQPGADGVPKDTNMMAVVTIGFVKDAKHHIDVQGFNVYHKNRLIKPFWRIWNAAGSDGRGVIGVLEANFVEPAHDKQGFERTTALSRLEARLVQMQKTYWRDKCQEIGYAPRRSEKASNGSKKETSPDYLSETPASKRKGTSTSNRKQSPIPDKTHSHSYHTRQKQDSKGASTVNGHGQHLSSGGNDRVNSPASVKRKGFSKSLSSTPPVGNSSDDEVDMHDSIPEKQANDGNKKTTPATRHASSSLELHSLEQLKEENRELKERLVKTKGAVLADLRQELLEEKDRCKSLETQLQEAHKKIEELNKEQESLIDIFSEERDRRDNEERNLRQKLLDASHTIEELRDKVRLLEKAKLPSRKVGR